MHSFGNFLILILERILAVAYLYFHRKKVVKIFKPNDKTIKDFGNQWQIHSEVREDFWTSDEMFKDHFPKSFDLNQFRGKVILEIGSGSGRILQMISRYKPKSLIGVEPSSGFQNLAKNTKSIPNLKIINESGADFQVHNLDYVISFGVIHHIPEPDPVITNAFRSLKPGGQLIVWVYGKENNQPYVLVQSIIRNITKFFPDILLDKISLFLTYIADSYAKISSNLFNEKLPLTEYLIEVFGPCARQEKKFIIFDQLNPDYAKYYKQEEIQELLTKCGFETLLLFHRHGYSWTAIGSKPYL